MKIGRAVGYLTYPFLCALLVGLIAFSVEADVKTIVIPSPDEQLRIALNMRARQGNHAVVETDEKWVTVLLRLHPDVVQPIDDPVPDGQGDYPAIGKLILAIPGITGVEEMVDGRAPSEAPTGDELRIVVETHLRSRPIPEPPP